MTVWMEPEGADFTLLAGESLEIVASATQHSPWFDVVSDDTNFSVCIEGGPQDYVIFANGVRIEIGHNREHTQWHKELK
jgi:hypothetical protein